MSLYSKPKIKLTSIWDLESDEEDTEERIDDTPNVQWSEFPREEWEQIKAKTRQGCNCDDCERAIDPTIRPDFSALRKIFSSDKLLRHAAIFAGTRKINEKIVDHFHTTWRHPMHMGVPNVEFVSFMMSDTSVCQRFDDYMSELLLILDDPNVKPLWHGTKVNCKFADKPCDPTSLDSCAGCNILSKGFDISKSGSANPFKRFGTGIYFAPNSSKAHSYATPRGGAEDLYTILFCFVALGRCHTTIDDIPGLAEPPYPCHSVHGRIGHRLNYEEYVIYRPDAVVPFAAVTYRMTKW
ncbi:32355_t:CDS:2 [Gigaspora margarita]|uniref:32355_t:CDS:1 n=2 Tax=Gigaspora margarita TaxID=4874 RepID=A0ABN7UGK2_GIGMA|nr:ADP-ribosylation [Gigaspora margarita]CAG8591616.1 32355_t:CDS:2 [Gigaspora margarita]